MAGIRFDQPDGAKRAIVAGNSAASKLIERVSSTKKGFGMPPIGDPLTAEQVALLKAWIDQGAKMPAGKGHWAFQPIRKVAVPAVQRQDWGRNPIDAFILARLEKEGVQPSPEASKTTLLRRVSIDLTGLPPTRQEVVEFLSDNSPEAYEHVVDRLLASPHYGEKWARQWLDLARYADSDGYEKDLVRPWAWRYRDWVIRALNSDMPFDQFTRDQIAGDLAPNATTQQRIATGFHRNVLVNREAGVDRAEARFEQMVNRTNTMSTVWLGLTMGCSQCHNHKYDPILQKDYYSMMAFVNSLEEKDIDAPLPGEFGEYIRTSGAYRKERNELLEMHEIAKYQSKWEDNVRKAIANPGKDIEWDFTVTSFVAMEDGARKLILTPETQRSQKDRDRLTNYFLRNIGPEFNRDKSVAACLSDARKQLAEVDSHYPHLSQAMTVVETADGVKTHIAKGGDYRAMGDEVQPATPGFLGPSGGKTRLDLVRWIMSKDNPLTARVAVNRMWQEFFGKGLVRTSEDFGTQGEKPTHPELLDWLATEFRDNGWRVKPMHKLIVMSAAYRQSSHVRQDLETKDPDNSLIARQQRIRLSAELVRDAALEAGGILNDEIGGRSVRPPLPPGIAELGYANSVKWVADNGPERYRRGLYIHFQRTTPYPQLVTFDAPDSTVACTRRSRSNTPLQALNLLNDPVFMEAAQGLASQILQQKNDRLEYAFQTSVGRNPTAREKERLATYLDQQLSLLRKNPQEAAELMPAAPEGSDPMEAAAWVGVSRVLLNLDEFITRE